MAKDTKPEPIERPSEGGSSIRDKKTGRRTPNTPKADDATSEEA